MSIVRDMVTAMRVEIEAGGLTPGRTFDLLASLTALLGNCGEEAINADIAYNVVLGQCLDAEEKANRAKIRAETSLEYREKRMAANTYVVTMELVRSLKKILDGQTQEMRLAR